MLAYRACAKQGLARLVPAQRVLIAQRGCPSPATRCASVVAHKTALTPAASETADTEKRKPARVDWAIRKQLQYLKGPPQIAEHVQRMLSKGEFDDALQLVREASRDTQVTVSWNYLIDHLMSNQRVHAAIKCYNDMKKRAQLPNSQTYTHIFKGCAGSVHPKMAAAEAIRIYHTMLLERSRVKPNTVHMNAVMAACAKATDIESMFGILETTKRPIRTPDAVTYTILLTGLRGAVDSFAPPRDHPEEERMERVRIMVQRGQRIWAEVVNRWRQGEIGLDQRLVAAMGRLLLLGTRAQVQSIFALVEETTNIKLPVSGSPASLPRTEQSTGAPDANEQTLDNTDSPIRTDMGLSPTQQSGGIVTDTKSDDSDSNATTAALTRASSVAAAMVEPSRAFASYAKPGTKLLSVVLEAASRLKQPDVAMAYWNAFTTHEGGFEPDVANWIQLLKVLSLGRPSGTILNLVEEMPHNFLCVNIYRTAILACMREDARSSTPNAPEPDKTQPTPAASPSPDDISAQVAAQSTAFHNATAIFDHMTKSLPYPDPSVMNQYLYLAWVHRRAYNILLNAGNAEEARKVYGTQLLTALNRIFDVYFDARESAEALKGWKVERFRYPRLNRQRVEFAKLARKMSATYDRMIDQELVEPGAFEDLRRKRNRLTGFVHRESARPQEEEEGEDDEAGVEADRWERLDEMARRERTVAPKTTAKAPRGSKGTSLNGRERKPQRPTLGSLRASRG